MIECMCGGYYCDKCYPNKEEEIPCLCCGKLVAVKDLEFTGLCEECCWKEVGIKV